MVVLHGEAGSTDVRKSAERCAAIYAFILDRGQIDLLPTHIDYPFLDGDRLFVRVVYEGTPVPGRINPRPMATLPSKVEIVDDQMLVSRGLGAFLKVFDDIKLREDAALKLSAQGLPDVVVIDEDEFNKRVAEHEADRLRSKRLKMLFDKTAG